MGCIGRATTMAALRAAGSRSVVGKKPSCPSFCCADGALGNGRASGSGMGNSEDLGISCSCVWLALERRRRTREWGRHAMKTMSAMHSTLLMPMAIPTNSNPRPLPPSSSSSTKPASAEIVISRDADAESNCASGPNGGAGGATRTSMAVTGMPPSNGGSVAVVAICTRSMAELTVGDMACMLGDTMISTAIEAARTSRMVMRLLSMRISLARSPLKAVFHCSLASLPSTPIEMISPLSMTVDCLAPESPAGHGTPLYAPKPQKRQTVWPPALQPRPPYGSLAPGLQRASK